MPMPAIRPFPVFGEREPAGPACRAVPTDGAAYRTIRCAAVTLAASLGAVILLATAAAARDPSLDRAQALMAEGRFNQAAEAAAAAGGSDGFALAAEALTIYGHEIAPDDRKQALFQRAVDYAQQAIELDPANSEAYLQYSHSLGRYAQTLGVLDALNGGYADRIKAALDKTIALDPTQYRAFVSLGAWHAAVIDDGGFMARMLYGASEDGALAAYKRALEIAPEVNSVHLEYAIGLMKLDDDNIDLARRELQKAIELPADDAYGRIVRDKANRRLAELNGE